MEPMAADVLNYLREVVRSGGRPVIRFTDDIAEQETNFDPGQLAEVKQVGDGGDDVPVLKLDFSRFEDHNQRLGRTDYRDEGGNYCLPWHKHPSYPIDRIDRIWIDIEDGIRAPFEIVDGDRSLKLFARYSALPNPKGAYLSWLEEELDKLT